MNSRPSKDQIKAAIANTLSNFKSYPTLYLGEIKDFFFTTCLSVIARRHGKRIQEAEKVWEACASVYARLVVENPYMFCSSSTSYDSVVYSIAGLHYLLHVDNSMVEYVDFILLNDTSGEVVNPALDVKTGECLYIHSYIDRRIHSRGLSTNKATVNRLEECHKGIEFLEHSKAEKEYLRFGKFSVKEAILTIAQHYNVESGLVDVDSTLSALKERRVKQQNLKQKYFDELVGFWEPRQFGKASRVSNPLLSKQSSSERISIAKWKKLFRYHLFSAVSLFDDNPMANLFVLLAREGFSGISLHSVVFNFWQDATKHKIPFTFYRHELEDFLRSEVEKVLAEFHLDSPVFRAVAIRNKEVVKRVKNLKASFKTKNALYEASPYYSLIQSVYFRDINLPPFIRLYRNLAFIGVNQGVIRLFFRSLFSSSLWDGSATKKMHDVAFTILPLFDSLLDVYIQKPSLNKDIYNKVFDLLLSEINSDPDINVSYKINRLIKLPEYTGRISKNDFSSLSELFGLMVFNSKDWEESLRIAGEKGIKVEEDDKQLCLNMSLSTAVHKYLKMLNAHNNSPGSIKPFRNKAGKVTMSIEPNRSLKGIMGCGVNGVCISFTSRHHLDHHAKGCMNFIVYDESRIMLWGLLVPVLDRQYPCYVLNNLQGSLPTKYARNKGEVESSIKKFLSSFAEIYTADHYFNAVNLGEGLEFDHSKGLVLPKGMRLDVPYDKETGKVPGGTLKVIPRRDQSIPSVAV